MYSKKNEKKTQVDITRTELASLGEFGLIDHLTKSFPLINESSIKGIGDDAAVIDTKGKLLLLSTDLLIEGVHFDLSYMPLRHLGYKAVAVNVSDIAAMNGIPRQITVSIAVSNRFPVEALDELYAGIRMACDFYKVDLVGGDTSSSNKGLLISVTVTGEAAPEEIVYRNGAKEGDLICVTGDLGGAYMGLLLLEREKEVYKANPNMQPELEGFEYVLARQLKPAARTDIRNLLIGADIHPTAMIDISDGLASEIMHICKQSGTGCRIYEEKIPVADETKMLAVEFKIAAAVCALSGGEDYELLFTIKQTDFEKIKDLAEISVIGHITPPAGGEVLVTTDGITMELKAQGWDAMSNT